jgi:hypothetical protein
MKRLFFLFFFTAVHACIIQAADTSPHRKGELIVMLLAGTDVQQVVLENAICKEPEPMCSKWC